MNAREVSVKISGSVMMMHNGQMADPLNPYAKALKALTSNRKKGDEDHESIAKCEFQGGLYFDDKMGPYLPSEAIEGALIGGAKRQKLGKAFTSAVRTADFEGYALAYEGPRTRDALWSDRRFTDRRGVVVGQARVMRTRPVFRNWSCKFRLLVEATEINIEHVRTALVDAGRYVGLGDYRPKYGLFEVTEFS